VEHVGAVVFVFGGEDLAEAEAFEYLGPGVRVGAPRSVVVAEGEEHFDSGLLGDFQRSDRVIECFRGDVSFVEEVAADEDRIHSLFDSVLQAEFEASVEIGHAFRETVLLVPQVGVAHMQEAERSLAHGRTHVTAPEIVLSEVNC
jgi:hypothetical protein